MIRRTPYYQQNEEKWLRRYENKQRRLITDLIERYNSIFLTWYKIMKQIKIDEIVFYKEFDSEEDFVYLRTDNIRNTPLFLVDTPIGSFAFFFVVPVKEKPFVNIYEYHHQHLQDSNFVIQCIKEERYDKLDMVFYYDDKGIVTDYKLNLKFYNFLKYVVTQRIPLETRKKFYMVTENLERYYLARYKKII